MALINCPECGKEISDTAKTCPNCGFEMQNSDKFVQEINCPYCGANNHPKAEYCLECSMRLISYENAYSTPRNESGPVVEEKKKNRAKEFILTGVLVLTLLFIYALFDSDTETPTNASAITTKSEEKTNAKAVELADTKEIKLLGESQIYAGHDVLIDVSGIEITEKSTEINFIITNNSNEDYSMSARTYSVNKLMAGGNLYGSDLEVPSNKKSNFKIVIENQWMSENNINDIQEMEIVFWAYKDNSKAWNSEKIQIKTNLYQKEGGFVAIGSKIYSDKYVALWYVGRIKNEYNFIIKNNSTYNAEYTLKNCSINEWSYELNYDLSNEQIHSDSFDTFIIDVDADFMAENKITSVENITFSIELNEANWDIKGSPWEVSSDKISIDMDSLN